MKSEQIESYSEFINNINDVKKKTFSMSKTLQSDKHPFIKEPDIIMTQINELFERLEKSLQSEQKNLKGRISKSHDTLLTEITEIFKEKVGPQYDCSQLMEIHKIGEFRYRNNIPPGYEDAYKKINKFGDLIIWFQMIDKSKETKKPIIFISNDQKNDWLGNNLENKRRPRPELLSEMKSQAGTLFYIFSLKQFKKYSEKYLNVSISDATIKESEDIALAQLKKDSMEEIKARFLSSLDNQRTSNMFDSYNSNGLSGNYLNDAFGSEASKFFSNNTVEKFLSEISQSTIISDEIIELQPDKAFTRFIREMTQSNVFNNWLENQKQITNVLRGWEATEKLIKKASGSELHKIIPKAIRKHKSELNKEENENKE